jgi:hypothetical protein
METGNVAAGWRTSVIVAGLVTGIAFILHVHERSMGIYWRLANSI